MIHRLGRQPDPANPTGLIDTDEPQSFVRALNDLTPSTSLDEGIGGFLDTVKAMGRVVPDSH